MEESIKFFCVTPIRRIGSFGGRGVELIVGHYLVVPKELFWGKIDYWKILISSYHFFLWSFAPHLGVLASGSSRQGDWVFCWVLHDTDRFCPQTKNHKHGKLSVIFANYQHPSIRFLVALLIFRSLLLFLIYFIAVTCGRMGLIGATWCY